ncbi:MAG: CocE/NonD family hydrolase, partial [Candidatus Hydrogenedentota bacterium]
MRKWLWLAVPALCLSLLPACWAAAELPSPTGTVMVPMRDGVELETDYYLPAEGEGPYPAILARSVYGREMGPAWANEILPWGIALVLQDTRGRGGSEGEDRAFADDGWGERRDGVDTVEWIREQDWCNGAVGTRGGSALGLTQLFLAAAGADVQAQFIAVAASEFHGQLAYQGGVWRTAVVENWLEMQGLEHIKERWQAHPTYDAFWRDYDFASRASHVTAPAIHFSGWFDIFAQGNIDNFLTRQYEGGAGARGNQIMVMGPWSHNITQEIGDLTLPENYNFDIDTLSERFFKHWLLEEDAGVMEEPPVHYYTLGDVEDPDAPGNEWRRADTWPPFETESTPLYLSPDGQLHGAMEDVAEGTQRYTFDPADPVPTHGGQNLFIPAGPFDQQELGERDDVLVFATEPLEEPLEITGRVTVDLYVSTDAPDTDFTAKLVDIYPDGREILMLDSIQRVKFRDGFEEPDPLPEGDIGKVTIDLWSISLVFNEGHRIGLHISSSTHPRFEVNPNSGDDFPTEDNLR